MLSRRTLLQSLAAAAAVGAAPPVKIGHREASMRLIGDLRVFEVASRIPGLLGVELQVASGDHTLWSRDILRRYKREAHKWGMQIPSLSSPFGKGTQLMKPGAEEAIRKAIAAAEFLGSSVLLVPSFRDNCPDLAKPEQVGPVVEMMKRLGPAAADSGVVLGLENSLNPSDNAKLVDMVAHPNVRMYFDLDNGEFYGHKGQIVPGVKVVGRERIAQVHVKNEERLIEEPGRIDWRAAFRELKAIGYDGWYVLESRHTTEQQIVDSTTRNIQFIKQQLS
jgi:sugar phosphate isomerase/epimerase